MKLICSTTLILCVILSLSSVCALRGSAKIPENKELMDSLSDSPNKVGGGACVTLVSFSDDNCEGKITSNITFPTTLSPGSPCYHDDSMKILGFPYSVKDQYCDIDDDSFRQTLVFLSKTCEVCDWFKKYLVQEQKFTRDECFYGWKLGSCTLGACSYDVDAKEEEDSLEKEK